VKKMVQDKAEKDLWIEMSIGEISTQARFADIAYKNIDPKATHGTDVVFSSIHSFLSHCAMISKMLKATNRGTSIGAVLGIASTSSIHKRTFRNNLEHYDKELKRWIARYGVNASVGTYVIAPKAKLKIPNMIYVSHYDPTNSTFTFVNEEFDLRLLYQESQAIRGIADKWMEAVTLGRIQPPFA